MRTMTSPYSTPRYPGVPHPTPRSTQKALRPPIHNPYDKFTQPEFDAWISDITGALKRALGREDAPLPSARVQSATLVDEEVVEDSFADVKARRLAKGKERARDEDFAHEQAAEERNYEQERDDWGEPYEGGEYSAEESEEDREASPEVIELLSDDEDAKARVRRQDEESEEEEETEEEGADEYGEEAEGSDVQSDDTQESQRSSPAVGPSAVAHSFAHQVTEILDSDEEEEAEEEEGDHRSLPARFQRKPDIVAPARLESDEGEEYSDDADEEQGEDERQEEADAFPPRAERKEPVDIDDPWRGPATYAEDFYSSGDFPTSALERGHPHKLLAEEGGGEDDELLPEEPERTPDIPDPWEGPRTFAEDFYAGGDALPPPGDGMTPSHLTPSDDGRLFIPGISDASAEALTSKEKGAPMEVLDVDDSYQEVDKAVDEPPAPGQPGEVATSTDGGVSAVAERSTSSPSAPLRTHVNWNWPPAFPGRVATGPGHIESPEREILEISDDDEPNAAVDLERVPHEPVRPREFEPAETQAGAEDQEPISVEPADTSDLYAGFSDLYDMSVEDTPFDLQSSFEPVSPPGVSFGDLPPPTGGPTHVQWKADTQPLDINEATPSAADINAQDILTSAIPESAVSAFGPDKPSAEVAATAEEILSPATASRRFSVGLEEVTDEEDPDWHPARVSAQFRETKPGDREHEPEMVVIEAEDDEDDVRSSVQPADDIDISSVRDDDVETSGMEYIVEEAKTEGRRTAEPEPPEVVEEPGESEEATGPFVRSVSPQDISPIKAGKAGPEVEEPQRASFAEHDTVANEDPASKPEDAAPKTFVPRALERKLSASNIPPPVAANPNVPDPASLPHTPSSPASPEAQSKSSSPDHEEYDAMALPANRALYTFRTLASESHSPSGLFTPLTAENSGSMTPDRELAYSAAPDERELQEGASEMVETAEAAKRSTVDAIEGPEESVQSSDGMMGLAAQKLTQVHDAISGREDVVHGMQCLFHPVGWLSNSSDLPDLPAEETIALPPPTKPSEVGPLENETPDNAMYSTVVACEFAVEQRDATPATDADVDADGEMDLEYVPSGEEATEDSSIEVDEDETADAAVQYKKVVAGSPEQETESEHTKEVAEGATPTAPATSESEVTPRVSSPTVEDKSGLGVEAVTASPAELLSGETEDEARPLKRKRGFPAPISSPTRVTRSKTSRSIQAAFQDHIEKTMAQSRRAKGRQQTQPETDEEDNASVAHSHTSESTSGDSSIAAQKMLVADSRGTSRASSVVSNAPSAYSGLSQPSPTIDRTLPSNGHHAPPPFIHNNGILHHHHGRPVVPVVPAIQNRQPSEPLPQLNEVVRRASTEPGPSSQPMPSKAPAMGSTSSPVTRSNCRFHTISIPKEENGPRIHFAVPGCSLGNVELMKNEHIEDQGLVKADDIPRLIRDIESLSLSPYLVGVLRQLVGVDLLREQEVFYIPRPDDGVLLKSNKRAHRAKLKQIESISARTLSNGAASRSKQSRSMAPPSQVSVSTSGDSASVAGRLSQRGSVATTTSLSGSELSDLENDEEPPPKRAKETNSEAVAEQAVQPSEPPADIDRESVSAASVVPQSRKLQSRRSRRLGVDAAAYKPEEGESDGSDGSEDDTKKRRKRGGKRGVKRTRADENGEAPAEGSSEKVKRRRVRPSTSNGNGDQPSADAGESAN
ncbi:hypothetical protein BD414DRAFT_498806 [Trametes punicea]|nr:hypothetical protein BD414DRAFT_498806 [Trametes punicea]